jgi:hypothetical protein
VTTAQIIKVVTVQNGRVRASSDGHWLLYAPEGRLVAKVRSNQRRSSPYCHYAKNLERQLVRAGFRLD